MKIVKFNPEKCMSCKSCLIACAIEHSDSKHIFTAVGENPKPVTRLQLRKNKSSVSIEKCAHCDLAPCIDKCQSHALYKDHQSQSVIVDYSKCKSCGICIKVCPNKAFVKINKLVFKCDGCLDRVKQGDIPACVAACKTGSLTFSDHPKMLADRVTPKVSCFSWGTVMYSFSLSKR